MSSPWSDTEIDLTIRSYFEMLRADIAGRRYNKAQYNRDLQGQIPRSKGAIEFKHQNISAVLLGLGQPWIRGYKPASNFQMRLIDRIVDWLKAHPDWLVDQSRAQLTKGMADASPLWIGPPPTHQNEPPPVDADAMRQIALKYDVVERDARNRALGEAGEAFAFYHEQLRLNHEGRADLAEQVRWTARDDGDGYGYDIASFEPDGAPRLIEVKTTNGWERTPFHISRNECRVAEQKREHWCLLRLYDFAREPKAFELRPPLDAHLELIPESYLARPI